MASENSVATMHRCVLTPVQEAALTLVYECFGGASDEYLQFCKFLVVQKQGLEWLEDSINPEQEGSTQ